MEALAADIGKTFIEKLINGAIEKSRYIFCFTCIVKDFDGAKLELEAERRTMEQRFKVAIEKDKDILYNAQNWKKQVDSLIQEDTKTKQKCLFGFCPDCVWRYKTGHDLETKTEEIKKLTKEGEKFENVELDRPFPGVERYSSQYYISFKSRKLKFEELLNALKDGNNYLTGLHGMGGSGKTTLAREVGKHLKAMKQFDHVIDTTVSNTPDIKKIQDDIAGSLGLKWEDCNESDRPKKLWSRLTNDEKILVILDDVWGDLNFDNIGLPSSDNHKGCRVLVTTRYLWVCNKMGCGNTIQLELLTEEEALIMFKMYADINNNFSSKSFLNKGCKIAIECKRLPVAIAVIGRSLKGKKRQEEWDAALTFLQKPMSMAGVANDLVDIYKCLKFSYDNLKDESAKSMFLLCSIFEEDAEIPVEFLTRLAIGVGIFGEYYSSYEVVRGQAIEAKYLLLDSCLLLETEKKYVKMHDIVREVAQWIANKEIQRIKFSNKNQKSLVERDKNIKYLFCEGKLKDLFSSKFDGSKLELLFVNMDLLEFIDIPISFLKNIIEIRVLILIHNADRQKLSLLQSIQSLTNMRTLKVQNVNLGNISALGKLPRLETLDLVQCDFDNLPCEIEKLKNLRLLNLENCKIKWNNPFEVIQNCSSLEVLYFCNNFNEFWKEITLPSTLQRYRLIDNFNDVPDSLSKCVSLKQDNFTEATYKYVIETAEFVKLEKIEKGWRNFMPEIVPIDKGMNDLVELHLYSNSQLKFLVDTKHIDSQLSPNVFSKLVVLILWQMENMEALGDGSISFDSFSNLEVLDIEHCEHLQTLFKCNLNLCNLKAIGLSECNNLVSVFELSTSKTLVMLEKLIIEDCEKLENIFTYERRVVEYATFEEISSNPIFPKLKVVDIKRCRQLQFIFPLLSSEDYLSLEDISIGGCASLKYIFGQHQQVELASLTKLTLSSLPNFIDIFPESHHSTIPSSISQVASKPQTELEPKKSSTFSWSHMCCYGNKLRDTTTIGTNIPLVFEDQQQQSSISMVSNSNGLAECFSRSISPHIMCNIKEISLWRFSKKKSMFILSIAPIMTLESLRVGYCDEMKHIIINTGSGGGNIVFPKLKTFQVLCCKKLEYIFGHINAVSHDDHHQDDINIAIIHLHFPSLEHLELHHLPSLISMCTKNFCTTLPSLTKVELIDCSKLDIKSIGDLSVPNDLSLIAQESTTIKELSGNMEHSIALKSLVVKNNSKLESIFFFSEQKMSLTLEDIELHVLPMMVCPFVGPRDTFSLQNLTRFQIMGCEKLKSVFPTSIIQYLPHMESISIEECHELNHIIEDDDDLKIKKEMSRTCFRKLSVVIVINCNKLKNVFPFSVCKELPQLKALAIREANELEEIFKSEDDDAKVEIPNLKWVVLVNLPSLFHSQRIHFQAVENRSIQNCPKLSLNSALTPNFDETHIYKITGGIFYREWNSSKKEFMDQQQSLGEIDTSIKPSHENNNIKMTQTLEAEHEFIDNLPIMETNSEELMNEQSMDQQISLGENDTNIKHSQGNNLEGSTSEQETTVATMSTLSETKNEPTIHLVSPKLKGIKKGFEEETTLESSSSTPFITFESKKSSHEGDDGQIDMTSFPITTTEKNDEVKERPIVEQQSPKGDEIIVLKTRPSSIASQFPSMPFEGDTSETIEDLSSSMLITKEVEELVSKKHLDYENLSLLTDFFVKNPWVRLRDTSLSNRYKGCAYKLLAELLKFVQTHSVLDVLGSYHSEFVELLHDARSFGFDKDWLDGIEKRALFPDIQVSQNALLKLLDSKQQVTKDIEMLCLKIDIFSQRVEDLTHQLTSAKAVLENITQQETALSAPIGY